MDMVWTHRYSFVFFNEWIIRHAYYMDISKQKEQAGSALLRKGGGGISTCVTARCEVKVDGRMVTLKTGASRFRSIMYLTADRDWK